ncbi:MAG: prepilin peptidase [Caldilineaceae bacterium]
MISTILLSVVVGWTFGGLGNWLADALPAWRPAQDDAGAFSVAPSPLARPSLVHWAALLQPSLWRARPRLPLLLLATLLVCVAASLVAQDWTALWLTWLYAAFLLTVLVIDLEHRRVLNVMLAPAALVALAASLLPGHLSPGMALLGGAIGFGFFLLLGIVGRGALGAGDVKLMGVVGLMVGYPAILTAIVAGTVLGAVVALLLLASRRATRKSTFAYAPWLALGALFALRITFGG